MALSEGLANPTNTPSRRSIVSPVPEAFPSKLPASAAPQASTSAPIEVISPDGDYGEQALVERLKSGEPGAFEQVIRDAGSRMFATAMRMLGNEDDAREAVQDALLSAFRNIANFDAKSKLSTWMHRIVVNAALMKLRTKRRKPSVSLDDLRSRAGDEGRSDGPQGLSRRGEGEHAPLDAETRLAVRDAIEDLPEEYRTVLMLRDVEGLDTEETGVVLGLSTSAVKTRLHRARQALAERLGALVQGAP
jgi:RNA polymerase sigma-70 factor (ECF subfamily)